MISVVGNVPPKSNGFAGEYTNPASLGVLLYDSNEAESGLIQGYELPAGGRA